MGSMQGSVVALALEWGNPAAWAIHMDIMFFSALYSVRHSCLFKENQINKKIFLCTNFFLKLKINVNRFILKVNRYVLDAGNSMFRDYLLYPRNCDERKRTSFCDCF